MKKLLPLLLFACCSVAHAQFTVTRTAANLVQQPNLTFVTPNWTGNQDGEILTLSSLTATRVPFASTGGLIVDSALFTFAVGSGTLNVSNLSATGSVSTGVGGSTAGVLELGQGTAPAAGTNSWKLAAPTSVTSYITLVPGATGTGFWLGTNSGGTETITRVAGASAATASTVALRDSSANLSADSFIQGYATTATAAGTTTLTVDSVGTQFFTGSTTQTVVLPVTSTLVLGQTYRIVNNSSGLVTIQSSGANSILVMGASTSAVFTCILTSGTSAASWSYSYIPQTVLSGTSGQISVSNSGIGATTVAIVTSAALPGSPTVAGTASTAAGGIVTTDGTQTLQNKRTNARITTITSNATPTVNTDNCDCVTITALAAAITSMTTNLSGTPVNFDQLEYRIKDDGTARAITWGASFAAGPTALPTTTTVNKALHVWFEYDSVQAKWVCMSSGSDA